MEILHQGSCCNSAEKYVIKAPQAASLASARYDVRVLRTRVSKLCGTKVAKIVYYLVFILGIEYRNFIIKSFDIRKIFKLKL